MDKNNKYWVGLMFTVRFGTDISQYTFFYKRLIFWNTPQTLFSKVGKKAPESCLKIFLKFAKVI